MVYVFVDQLKFKSLHSTNCMRFKFVNGLIDYKSFPGNCNAIQTKASFMELLKQSLFEFPFIRVS